MKIDILTLFPGMFDGFLKESIIGRAIKNNIVEINIYNFRDYSNDPHKKVDDYGYGGGAGMVLMPQPIYDCLMSIKDKDSYVIMMTPQGHKYNQKKAYEFSKKKHIIILCGHYEGFDERIKSIVDMEISIGDYVLTGGELPSMIITDSVTRLLPGVIEEESHLKDSFNDNLLDYPQYTKPREFKGMKVPDVLLSGDHKKIDEWRKEEQIKKTKEKRPDLLEQEKLRKKIGKYSLMEDTKEKKVYNINITNSYNFMPKSNVKKEDIAGINKVMLVKPSFVEAIAKKNIKKKMDVLLKQIAIVLNDETDDEGTNYVLGEIDRITSIIINNYKDYLSKEYITLLINKLKMLKDEVNLKQLMNIQTVEYERGRHL